MRTERSLVSMRPAGSMAFWPASAAWMSSAVSPRSASATEETSMKMRSSCVPEQIDLGDAGNAQQDVARVLGEGLELGIAVALAGDGIERDVGVAELVVEEGADHALGQRLADVADLLAHLIEGVLDGLAAHRALAG